MMPTVIRVGSRGPGAISGLSVRRGRPGFLGALMEGACDAEKMGHSVNIKSLGAAGYAIFQLAATCSPRDTSLGSPVFFANHPQFVPGKASAILNCLKAREHFPGQSRCNSRETGPLTCTLPLGSELRRSLGSVQTQQCVCCMCTRMWAPLGEPGSAVQMRRNFRLFFLISSMAPPARSYFARTPLTFTVPRCR